MYWLATAASPGDVNWSEMLLIGWRCWWTGQRHQLVRMIPSWSEWRQSGRRCGRTGVDSDWSRWYQVGWNGAELVGDVDKLVEVMPVNLSTSKALALCCNQFWGGLKEYIVRRRFTCCLRNLTIARVMDPIGTSTLLLVGIEEIGMSSSQPIPKIYSYLFESNLSIPNKFGYTHWIWVTQWAWRYIEQIDGLTKIEVVAMDRLRGSSRGTKSLIFTT